jgi:signal transduction histidine kinase
LKRLIKKRTKQRNPSKPHKPHKPHKLRRQHAKKFPLKWYVWGSFMVVVIFILVLLWLFQYFFLPKYYRAAKIRSVMSAAENIIDKYDSSTVDEISTYAHKLAFDNNMFVLLTDEKGEDLVMENNMGDFSFFSMDKNKNFGKTLYKFRKKLDEQEDDSITTITRSDEFGDEEIFYCTKFSSGGDELYLFIEAPVEPIDSTVNIIRNQLVYITIILFELAFIATVIISRRISRPIETLTETAQKFGGGDYEVEFSAEGYKEIEELAVVLDEARNEVKKVTDLRKDLIANISHDLRTPLTMVKAYAEMIRDLSGNDPVKREKHCQIIIDEADRLSNLVNSILELSKLESSNMELNKTDYSVHEQIEDVLKRYTLMIEQNGYDIKFIPDDDRLITADYDKLSQVIYNFVNNAINYSGDEKHIRIKQINKPGTVRIEVIDNGQGIAKDKLSQVFDRYYRGGKVKRETVGTGLGLSICKEILKMHEFAFGVISEEGEGSTFWFEAKETPLPRNTRKSDDDKDVIEAEFIKENQNGS